MRKKVRLGVAALLLGGGSVVGLAWPASAHLHVNTTPCTKGAVKSNVVVHTPGPHVHVPPGTLLPLCP